MIQEDYVSPETAKLLKEKGFDGECSCYYFFWDSDKSRFEESLTTCNWNNEYTSFYSAPTLQMVMKWLREEKNFFIGIQCYGCEANEKAHFEYSYIIEEFVKYEDECTTLGLEHIKGKSRFNSYEEACEMAIKYCLENLI